MVFFQLSSTTSCIPRLSYRVNKQGMKVGDSLQDSVGICFAIEGAVLTRLLHRVDTMSRYSKAAGSEW